MPGCCVRTGCDGSGRGPPTGPCGRGPDTAVAGPARRRDAARPAAGGRAPGAPGDIGTGGPAPRHRRGRLRRGDRPLHRARRRRSSAAAASAWSDGSLRCAAAASAARRGQEPAASGLAPAVRRGAAATGAAAGGSAAGAGQRSELPVLRPRRVVLPAVAQRTGGASATAIGASGGGSGAGGASTGSGSTARFGLDDGRGGHRLRGFHQARRRQRRRNRLHRLGRLFRGRRLLALDGRRLGEDVAARQLNVPLLRESIDELARDHFLDRARGALDLDAVIALEQRRHFLARGAEQFCDLVNPNSCQTSTSISCSTYVAQASRPATADANICLKARSCVCATFGVCFRVRRRGAARGGQNLVGRLPADAGNLRQLLDGGRGHGVLRVPSPASTSFRTVFSPMPASV